MKKRSKQRYSKFAIVFVFILLCSSCCSFTVSPLNQDSSLEVHVVFLHGMPETPGVMEPLREKVQEILSENGYHLNALYPHLPDSECIDVWAGNIADAIDAWGVEKDIVIVGLSMGGKAAVHAVVQERFGLQNKVKAVMTINSPLRRFADYYNYFFGYLYPKPLIPLMSSAVFGYEKPDGLTDVIFYDSTSEANWLAEYKDCITFVSGERFPSDSLYDDTLGDRFPRVLDDGTVPISAQHTHKTATIYYGVKAHESVMHDVSLNGARDMIAENVSQYLLKLPVTYSYPVKSGVISHRSSLFSTDQSWVDMIDVPIESWSGFYEVKILKGGGAFRADIVNCSIVSNALQQNVLQISSTNFFPGTSFLIHWTIYGVKVL